MRRILTIILLVFLAFATLPVRPATAQNSLPPEPDSGAVVCALRKVAQDLPRNARVAILFPDSASRYLSTIFNDDWMREKGLL